LLLPYNVTTPLTSTTVLDLCYFFAYSQSNSSKLSEYSYHSFYFPIIVHNDDTFIISFYRRYGEVATNYNLGSGSIGTKADNWRANRVPSSHTGGGQNEIFYKGGGTW